jgi:EAL domain-containing protein (putative c-di-GMP-specific phosphodiesterase class I)
MLVGSNPSAEAYRSSIVRTTARVGVGHRPMELPLLTTEMELIRQIHSLNADPEVTGVLVLMPLPDHLNPHAVLEHLSPLKDIDGITPTNAGRLHLGLPSLRPSTPQGGLELLDHYGIEIEGKNVFPRASVGICLVGEEGETPEASELLRNADVAMYMAKRDSKGSYRVFEPTMHERVVERLELRSDLQHALTMDQLELHYQPVVRLADRTILGVEALVRWNHPTRGTIPPIHFIPVAEETGLIIPMGRWILETACHEGARLQKAFLREEPLTMSVNLSVRQLQSETLIADVRQALEVTGLPAASLVLEITESLMLTDTDFAMMQLHELKALGIRLAMDDFGTGYSSLSYLSRFPVDILKMDRSFVGAEENSTLTSAIIALGTSLSLEVVAEGIELAEQASSLEELGCELGQGFLFARPMDSDALTKFLGVDGEATQEDVESSAASNAA